MTDGERVYTFFQDAGLTAFTIAGRELWHVALGPFNMFYGFGASPIVVDGTVLLTVDQDTALTCSRWMRAPGKTRYRIDRPGVISGYSTPTVYRPAQGPQQILVPESFQLSAYAVADGRRLWWVRGLACEMKSVLSIQGDVAYVNGWGFPQNQAGTQVPTVPFADGLEVRREQGRPHRRGRDRRGPPRWTGCSARRSASRPSTRPQRIARCQRVGGVPRHARVRERPARDRARRRGRHDGGRREVEVQRPVPQVPSTLLYKGVLFMVNDSGILIAFDPATVPCSNRAV